VNIKDKSTHARARIGAYALDRTNDEVRRLVATMEPADLASIANMIRDGLTPAGFGLLKTILSMTLKAPLIGPPVHPGDETYQVEPFTRAELGNYLRKGERLNPHDIKLINRMVSLSVLRQERRPLPAQKMQSRYGGELMVGAGWEYVYILAPRALLALLSQTRRHGEYVAKLSADPSLEPRPEMKSESAIDAVWKLFTGR
jgi:hypothetical protein